MNRKRKRPEMSTEGALKHFGTRLNPKYLEEAKYYPGGVSQFIREAVISYKNNRHIHKFRDILSDISGELLILTAWKEKGHPGGLKWTEELEMMLAYYEKCFDVLMNSPFNDELED